MVADYITLSMFILIGLETACLNYCNSTRTTTYCRTSQDTIEAVYLTNPVRATTSIYRLGV